MISTHSNPFGTPSIGIEDAAFSVPRNLELAVDIADDFYSAYAYFNISEGLKGKLSGIVNKHKEGLTPQVKADVYERCFIDANENFYEMYEAPREEINYFMNAIEEALRSI